jgi:hypothetical protein
VNGNGNVAGNTVAGSGNMVGNDNRPIVIDAPGGMPIVGNTGIINNPTVNNLRPPERTIEANDETDLISALAQHPGTITFGALGTDPNSESQRFAQKLQRLFRAAGWTMLEQGIVPMYNSQTWSGVEVDAKGNLTDPIPNSAAVVVRALRDPHVKRIRITPHPDWGNDALLIIVGANPDY